MELAELPMAVRVLKVLLTGHRGYVGGSLLPLLLEKGHQVKGVDSDLFRDCVFAGQLMATEELALDVRDLEPEHLEGMEAVIHLAGLCNDPLGDLDPELTLDINYRATEKLGRLAKAAGVKRFVFASSCSVYGAGGQDWLDEESPLRPVTPYARSKLLSEEALTELADHSFTPVFLRAATVYGFSPKLRFDLVLNNLVAWALATKEVKLKSDGSPWRPLIHVDDLAAAFRAVLEADAQRVHCRSYNVGQTAENFRIRELAELVEAAVAGSRVSLAETAGPDKRCYRVRCDRIQEELPEFVPRWTVKTGVEQLAQNLRRATLSTAEFEGCRFNRKAHLLDLQERGLIDQRLRRIVPASP